jgi:ribose transport system permease protein
MNALTLQIRPDTKPILIAAGFILVILGVGTIYTLATQGAATLLSPAYLVQQLQTGAFLGLVAAGMMLVILIGHIDLSVAWTPPRWAGRGRFRQVLRSALRWAS